MSLLSLPFLGHYFHLSKYSQLVAFIYFLKDTFFLSFRAVFEFYPTALLGKPELAAD